MSKELCNRYNIRFGLPVGTKVKVREDLRIGEQDGVAVNTTMVSRCGMVTEVTKRISGETFNIPNMVLHTLRGCHYYYTASMLELIQGGKNNDKARDEC